MTPPIPPAWQPVLGDEPNQPYYQELQAFLAAERKRYTIYPPEAEVFTALELTPFDQVSVVLLGQDPYHNRNQAHGLAFSVRPGIPPPPSLLNVFQELHDDVGFRIPEHGYLARWAEQGVLLLNAVLTVRAHQANSHQGHGWETFTDAILRAVNDRPEPVVFLLWGNYARKKGELLTAPQHTILTAAHPSPFSANRGFFGCRHFSKTNAALRRAERSEIDWQI